MKISRFLTVTLAAVVLAGCAASQSGDAYTRGETRGEMSVRMGIIEAVRMVKIEGTKSPVGTLAGTALGGLAGSTLGGGRGSTAGAIVGAVVGGVAGSGVEEQYSREDGWEITVRLESGGLVAITQAATEGEVFKAGERVRILRGNGVSRVSH